jgi:MFS family permease
VVGGKGTLRATFRSMRWRNYRIYCLGQLLSFCGTWMQQVAQAWLVLKLSHNNGFDVGLVASMQTMPTLLLGTWSGVIVDRFSTRGILVATQLTMGTSAVLLGVVTFTNTAALWNVALLVAISGLGNMLDVPARSAFVNELVPAGELQNAVALNSTIVNSARIVGPAIGGLVLVAFGTGWCFMLNALSYVLLVWGLLLIRADELQPAPLVAKAKGQVREGLRYVRAEPAMWSNLVLTAVVGLLAFNFPVVLPVLAKVTFHGDAGVYSAMTVAMGVGSMFGALAVAGQRTTAERKLVVSGALLGLAMCGAAIAPSKPILFVMLALTGGFNIAFLAMSNALLQLGAAPTLRGRVLGLRSVTVVGGTSLGSLLVGWIVEHFGARYGLGLGGIAMFPMAAWYAAFLRRRHRLRSEEILPPDIVVVAAPEAATPAAGT